MDVVRTKVTQGGRIVIPADMRRRLGIEIGGDVNIALDGESIQVTTSHSALRRIQHKLNRQVPRGISLADELIAERRKEAENE